MTRNSFVVFSSSQTLRVFVHDQLFIQTSNLLIPFWPLERAFFPHVHVKVHEFQTDQSHKKAFTFVVKSSIFVENGSFNSLVVVESNCKEWSWSVPKNNIY